LSDWFFKQGGRHRLINWLRFDAWIDSTLSGLMEGTKDRFNAASSFFARFRLTGWRRLANELASEALTLGVGGLILVYAMALPAFKEIDEKNWLAMDQFSVTFQDKDGNVIGRRGINLDDAVPLEEIPDHLIKAVLATEDRRFFEHIGIDFLGTARALIENLRANYVVQGGSTLTQQLAKNLFLSPERSIKRKLKEVFLSLWLETRLTKRQILKLYLDRAYMGGGAFGVEAASRFYFGKSVRDISMAEAAMLAGLFKAPTKYAPHINLPASRARANDVLSNMVEAGFYTAGQVYNARLHPARPIVNRESTSPDWFLDYAYQEIQNKIKDKRDFVLTARTTIDMRMQGHAERALQSHIGGSGSRRGGDQLSGALVSMETDGAVRALVGGLDYGESQFNRATSARRQPGSSFKVYVYATALMNGYKPNTLLLDSTVNCGRWAPKNYSGGYGSGRRVTMQDALRVSLNTTAVRVSLAVGRKKVIALTKKLGITGIRPSCSMALGDTGITPLEHTGGFAAFASGGLETRPYAIIEVFNSKGELVYSHDKNEPKRPRAMPRRVAEQMNQMLSTVVTAGTGRRAQLDFTNAAGKTGTSSSYRDAWFMGFTGRYVTGVWIGKDNFRPVYRSDNGRGMTGGSTPASVWQAFMSVAHESMDIPTIPGLKPHPVQIQERERLAALRQQQPDAPTAVAGGTVKIISSATQSALKKLAGQLRATATAAGVKVPPPPDSNTKTKPAPDRKADLGSGNSVRPQ
jgi:penicillin-binding protein 1A